MPKLLWLSLGTLPLRIIVGDSGIAGICEEGVDAETSGPQAQAHSCG
jgi:hypothetical protein